MLVPSPPAVNDPPWFADDPVDASDRTGDKPVVSPVLNGDITWDDLARDEPDLAPWCAQRWLGAWRRLPEPPLEVQRTRVGLHTLAEWIVSPARAAANGKIGLRWTYGGFGTPFFSIDGRDRQVRVDGIELVVDHGENERRTDLTTLAVAADLAVAELGAAKAYTPTTEPDDAAPALVEAMGTAFFSDWFGFATSVLEQLRFEATPDEGASRLQIWPEHFDMAFEQGAESAGRRAGYGCSPGDADHPLPYAYVVPWGEVPDDPYWAEPHFRGAAFAWEAIAAAEDQRAAVLDFFRRGRDLMRMLPQR
ncbi:MAG: hypothetical protein QOG87_1460 [Actinomycetota bacterium]